MENINEKYAKYIIYSGNSVYIHYSVSEEYMKDLISNGYEILGYDGVIINTEGTLSPIYLIFDFSRKEDNYSLGERNNMALECINELCTRAIKEKYNLDNLYLYIIYRRVK